MKKKKPVKEEKFPDQNHWWKHLLAGALAGAISRSATAPLDRLKVFAQVKGVSFHVISGLRHLVQQDGFLGLWRGNGINMLKIMPETSSKFVVYEVIKTLFKEFDGRSLSVVDRFSAAAVAGIASQTIIYPIEVLKTRKVIQKSPTVTIRKLFKDLVKKNGYSGLFKGYVATMGGIVLFTGTDLCTYETVKLFIKNRYYEGRTLPLSVIMFSGVISCLIGNAVAYPLSMASTAVQANDKKLTARKILIDRYKKYGKGGMYKGAGMAYMKAIPSVSITYMAYERILHFLGGEMTQ